MPFIDNQLGQIQKGQLLQLARRSIEHGVLKGAPVTVVDKEFHNELLRPGAAFVTLHKQKNLRGCVGTLNAHQPLIRDVADNAFAAAFRDTRFPQVSGDELSEIHIEISVLTPREPITFSCQSELLEAIEPHIDGIVIEDGYYRSTFLPSVWEQLPDRKEFLQHLKLKAGMGKDYWSESIKAFRYRTISFGE
ncbi:MAG: AmmeMemoRadiSam system protein A [Gammaproteobacteria bacterium]|nr:AmmeMemoRadiSam system protein A [Gammaproteobacteria bacterium]